MLTEVQARVPQLRAHLVSSRSRSWLAETIDAAESRGSLAGRCFDLSPVPSQEQDFDTSANSRKKMALTSLGILSLLVAIHTRQTSQIIIYNSCCTPAVPSFVHKKLKRAGAWLVQPHYRLRRMNRMTAVLHSLTQIFNSHSTTHKFKEIWPRPRLNPNKPHFTCTTLSMPCFTVTVAAYPKSLFALLITVNERAY
jgi:hypothetical protein